MTEKMPTSGNLLPEIFNRGFVIRMKSHYSKKMWDDENSFFEFELKNVIPPKKFMQIVLKTDAAIHGVIDIPGKALSANTYKSIYDYVVNAEWDKMKERTGNFYEKFDQDFFEDVVLNLIPSEEDTASGYAMVFLGDGGRNSFFTSNELNEKIVSDLSWNPAIGVDTSKHYYSSILSGISIFGESRRELVRNKIRKSENDPLARPLINERKVAVISDINVDTTELEVFQSCYFASMLSTDISSKGVFEKLGEHEVKIGSPELHYPYGKEAEKKYLLSVSESSLRISNQLGINAILITKDNYIVFPRQNLTANQHAGEAMPSASGSMDWEDLEGLTDANFRDLCRAAAIREAREELGRNLIKIEQSGEINFLHFFPTGLYRGLVRGGKPDVAAFGKMDWRLDELRAQLNEIQELDNNPAFRFIERTERNTLWKKVEGVSVLKSIVDSLLKEKPTDRRISLDATLYCLSKAIESCPDRFATVFS